MGTLLTTLRPAFGDDLSLEDSFAQALRKNAAANPYYKRTATGRRNDLRSHLSRGILQKNPSASSLESQKASNLLERKGKSATNTEVSSSRQSMQTAYSRKSSISGSPSRRSLDVNRNPTVKDTTVPIKTLPMANAMQQPKPFQPEPWPTIEMIHEHLSKHEAAPSTLIFARFLPPNNHSQKYVEICYSATENPSETFLESSDKLETLVAPQEDFRKGDTDADEIKYFLLIFKTCMNSLQGQVWWNGYSFILDPVLKTRLKVTAFETQPISQLLFELTGVQELEVYRARHKIELRGEVKGNAENSPKLSKHFCVTGAAVRSMKVQQLRGNLITVHIPNFTPESITY